MSNPTDVNEFITDLNGGVLQSELGEDVNVYLGRYSTAAHELQRGDVY